MAFPVDAIVTKSMSSVCDGLYPPANKPLVGLPTPLIPFFASVKLPKSVASPVEAMVTKSITSINAGLSPPPANNPRV